MAPEGLSGWLSSGLGREEERWLCLRVFLRLGLMGSVLIFGVSSPPLAGVTVTPDRNAEASRRKTWFADVRVCSSGHQKEDLRVLTDGLHGRGNHSSLKEDFIT